MKQVSVSITTSFIVFTKTIINPLKVGVIFKSEIKTRKMRILLILLTLIPSYITGQQEIIESIKLDSLIFEKINEYRLTKNVKSFIVFEDSLMRDYAKTVANRNIEIFPTQHSNDLGYYSNSECLYTYRANYSWDWPEISKNITNEDFDFLAELAVQAWINSSTHEHQISRPDIDVTAIVSILIVDWEEKYIRFDSTFQGLSNNPNATIDNTYVYPR